MNERRRALAIAVLVGVTYLVIGRVFSWPATHVKAWRWAAWIVSAAVFGAHIAFEHFRLRNTPRHAAMHAALAAAIGALGIAAAGLLYTLSTGTPVGARWLIAILVFPVMTGVPAFIVALGFGMMLARISPRTGTPQ